MKRYLLLLLLASFAAPAQSLNNYQYLIIPVKFDFQNEINQYRLNSNAKYVLEQKGFKVFFSNDILPIEVAQNKCKAMYLDVIKKGSFMVTKMYFVIKDCQNNILYTSQEGRSKEKLYETAQREALLQAMNSMNSLHYQYQPQTTAAAPELTMPSAVGQNPQAALTADQLFAQPTANGYQLVDTTPKVVLRLTKTSQPDYYMAAAEGKQGVVYLKDGQWIFDYYVADQLVSEKLSIKF